MGYFNKNYHQPGTPPGTLVEHEAPEVSALSFRLIDYTDSDYTEKELVTPDECKPFLSLSTVTWIHVQGRAHPQTLTSIGELFGLHPLAMEDVLNAGQRPKIEEYEDELFVVMAMPTQQEESARTEQISLFVGENYIVSFHAGTDDPFEPLRKRLRKHTGRIRGQKADYLLYSILDIVIDQGFPVLESLGEQIEAVEDELLDSPGGSTLSRVHRIRRELLLLRRMLWPQREVLNYLLRGNHPLVREGTLLYFRDCYDHTIQIMDLVENYRDMATSMLDVYLSSVSYRLNEIMRVLTIIATIFIPLTFIVGVYGMNFSSNANSPWAMPELGWYYGYPMVWLIMIVVTGGMLVYFKRKNWL